MSPAYLALAAERRAVHSELYGQPEDHGYEFTSWVSPYTKGANASGGIALVLQDWASVEGLGATPHPEIQLHGRAPWLLINKRLQDLLARVLGTNLSGIYALTSSHSSSEAACLRRSLAAKFSPSRVGLPCKSSSWRVLRQSSRSAQSPPQPCEIAVSNQSRCPIRLRASVASRRTRLDGAPHFNQAPLESWQSVALSSNPSIEATS